MTEWQQKCQGIASGLLATKVDWNLWKMWHICVIFFWQVVSRYKSTEMFCFFFFSLLPHRPCAMVVPDFELICEIMLVAEGFIDARVLARKFITLYTLCKELLSKQVHAAASWQSHIEPHFKAVRLTACFFFLVRLEAFWGKSDTEVPYKSWFHRLGAAFFLHAWIWIRRCREFGCYSVANFL